MSGPPSTSSPTPSSTPYTSSAQARVLLAELAALGVTDVVLAPGSRSAPFAFALATESDPPADPEVAGIRLHVRIDERSAAFTALGLAKASGTPSVVVTTSGTAVANLHPAVLEADAAGVSLIVLSADRPPRLRGVGANQTIEQVGIFGSAVRLSVDVAAIGPTYWRDIAVRAVAAATGALDGDPGPVHLNVAFEEPLVPRAGADDGPAYEQPDEQPRVVLRRSAPEPYDLPPEAHTVVVAGDGAGVAARDLADAGRWPLLAEPSSGAVGGSTAIPAYRLLLDAEPLVAAVRRVVVFGRPTLSRQVARLLARSDVEVVVVAGRPRWADTSRTARLVVPAATTTAPPAAGTGEWLDTWRAAGQAVTTAIAATLAGEPGLTGLLIADTLTQHVGRDDLLVVGSSNPIRDLDLMATRELGEARIQANRGVAGIDGVVSTAIGAALASPDARAYALLGDLTFLHDANGLLLGPDEPRPDLTFVVVNDEGGGIFHLLEPGEPAYAGAFERVFGTPHRVDLAALCAAHGVPHRLVTSRVDLGLALAERARGLRVLEARVDRTRLRALHEQIAAAAADAIGRAHVAGSTP